MVDRREIYVGEGVGETKGEGMGEGIGVGNRDGMDESRGAGMGVGEGAGLTEMFGDRVQVSKPTVTLLEVTTVGGILEEPESTVVTLNREPDPKNTFGEEAGGVTGESDSDTLETWKRLRVGDGLATGLGIGDGAGLRSRPPDRLGSDNSCEPGSGGGIA